MLTEIAADKSLRYAVQLLSPARVVAKLSGRQEVTQQDIQEVTGMFVDAETSAQ